MVANMINPRALLHQVADDAPDEVVESLATVLVSGHGQRQLVAALETARRQLAASPNDALIPSQTEAPADVLQTDPLAQARQRGLWRRRELLRLGGPPLSGSQVANLMGLSRQAVDKRRRAGRLIGVSLGRRGYAYPPWQFSQEGVLPGWEAVLGDLRRHDPWMKLAFMLTPNDRLDGETPLSALQQGQVDRVREAAQVYGEHGVA